MNGKPFSGTTQVQNDKLFVSLRGLAEMLGGSYKKDERIGLVRIDVEGLPASTVVNASDALEGPAALVQFTVLEFYADW